MTISKERLNEIALEVALEQALLAGETEAENVWDDETKAFIAANAIALIRRVEAEGDTREFYCNNGDIDRVTTLPLVSEE